DTLDVFAVHGVGGVFGTLMIAVFGYASFKAQGVALLAVGAFTIAVTFALAELVRFVFPLRVSEEDEIEGLDQAAHGERAYDLNS
ncbi:MAG: ammonia channel protein, partial [Pseudomonadales bacterium]|nr:ammonia channel protein [Pseudomonadales bacterium]